MPQQKVRTEPQGAVFLESRATNFCVPPPALGSELSVCSSFSLLQPQHCLLDRNVGIRNIYLMQLYLPSFGCAIGLVPTASKTDVSTTRNDLSRHSHYLGHFILSI